MDSLKLEIFQRQVLLQCDCALRAFRDFESTICDRLSGKTPGDDAFYHAQMMLLAYANISKLLWAERAGNSRDERLALRQSLGVDDSFKPDDRTMRNHY
jgi:hypothetical protein